MSQPASNDYPTTDHERSERVEPRPAPARWAPLVPRAIYRPLVLAGLVLGVAGAIVLWIMLSKANQPFDRRLGLMLVLVGLGLVISVIPLVLGESTRLESGGVVDRADHVRGLTGSRVVALVAVAIMFAGVWTMQPADSAGDSRGSSQGGAGGGGGQGRR